MLSCSNEGHPYLLLLISSLSTSSSSSSPSSYASSPSSSSPSPPPLQNVDSLTRPSTHTLAMTLPKSREHVMEFGPDHRSDMFQVHLTLSCQ